MNRRAFLAGAGTAAAVLRDDWAPRLQALTQAAGARTPDDLARDEDLWMQVRHASPSIAITST